MKFVQNVTQASSVISEVNENIANSSSMTNDVSEGVEQVKERSLYVKQSSVHVQSAADELSNLAENLSALVLKFKIKFAEKETIKGKGTLLPLPFIAIFRKLMPWSPS